MQPMGIDRYSTKRYARRFLRAAAGLMLSPWLVPSAAAATLSGNLEGTLDVSGSPYQVVANITVQTGKTLTLSEGVVLLMGPGVGLTVNGALVADGTQAAPVVITSSQDSSAGGSGTGAAGQWGVLQFYNSSGSRLSNTSVRFGQKIALAGSSPQLNSVTIATMSAVAMTVDATSFPYGSGNSAFGSPINGVDLPYCSV